MTLESVASTSTMMSSMVTRKRKASAEQCFLSNLELCSENLQKIKDIFINHQKCSSCNKIGHITRQVTKTCSSVPSKLLSECKTLSDNISLLIESGESVCEKTVLLKDLKELIDNEICRIEKCTKCEKCTEVSRCIYCTCRIIRCELNINIVFDRMSIVKECKYKRENKAPRDILETRPGFSNFGHLYISSMQDIRSSFNSIIVCRGREEYLECKNQLLCMKEKLICKKNDLNQKVLQLEGLVSKEFKCLCDNSVSLLKELEILLDSTISCKTCFEDICECCRSSFIQFLIKFNKQFALFGDLETSSEFHRNHAKMFLERIQHSKSCQFGQRCEKCSLLPDFILDNAKEVIFVLEQSLKAVQFLRFEYKAEETIQGQKEGISSDEDEPEVNVCQEEGFSSEMNQEEFVQSIFSEDDMFRGHVKDHIEDMKNLSSIALEMKNCTSCLDGELCIACREKIKEIKSL